MNKEKELQLYYDYKSGNREARKELVSSLDKLIMSQVNKFANSGLPVTAIKLEGQRLALNSLDTYDPSKAQLNTHVVNNLKKLSRFVTTYQNVGYIPEPRALLIGQYNTIKSNLEADKGREPTVSEIADAMHVSIAEISRLQSELRSDLSTSVTGSSAGGDDDGDEGFYKYIQPDITDPVLQEAIDAVYVDADPLDKKILENTLGLYGSTRKKSKEIALMLALSDSEVKRRRQNLAKQLKELV